VADDEAAELFSVPTQEVCRCAGAQETRRS